MLLSQFQATLINETTGLNLKNISQYSLNNPQISYLLTVTVDYQI